MFDTEHSVLLQGLRSGSVEALGILRRADGRNRRTSLQTRANVGPPRASGQSLPRAQTLSSTAPSEECIQPITDSARRIVTTVYADLLNTKKNDSFLVQT